MRVFAVSAVERQQLLAALMLLVMALFVARGYPPAARWRNHLRIGSIVLFCIAAGLVFIEIVLWLTVRAR